jgi:hypothetical protein
MYVTCADQSIAILDGLGAFPTTPGKSAARNDSSTDRHQGSGLLNTLCPKRS